MKSLERFSIFSISATAGDPGVGEVFRVLMHKKLLILSKFDEYLPRGKYGSSPDLILLEFLVEGSHDWFIIPDAITMGRYAPKDNSIGIKIPMLKDISESVLSNDVAKVNTFLLEIFGEIGELITASKPLAKLDFDASKFNQDYQVFMQHLLDDIPR